jgi:hypothetical protein
MSLYSFLDIKSRHCKKELNSKLVSLFAEYDNVDVKEYEDIFKSYTYENYPTNTLLKKWIESNCTDHSIYEDKLYKFDTLLCYNVITCNSTNIIKKFIHDEIKDNKSISSICDYGAGLGLSTIELATEFPDIKFYYYDVENQRKLFEFILSKGKLDNIEIIEDYKKSDMYIILETLEHIKTPISFFNELKQYIEKYLCIATCFSTMGIGHYDSYDYDDNGVIKNLNGRKISRIFNKMLKNEFIYCCKGWNNKPRIFKKYE